MPITSERQAKKRVISLVRTLKEELSLSSPPQYTGIDDPIAKHLRIRVKEGRLSGHIQRDGVYHPDPPRIIIDPSSGSRERVNFSYFHEVGHHLIRNDKELYSFLNDYYSSDRELERSIEAYCDTGAAEFLVPASDVRAAIDEEGFSIQLLPQLDQEYPASKPAIAIQLAECASHKCIIVVCDYALVPHQEQQQRRLAVFDNAPPRPKLFVRYSASSPSTLPYRVGRYAVIPRGHLIATAYYQRRLVTGRADIPFKSRTEWIVACEALFYKEHVYASFNITQPTPRQQLAFAFEN